jgi:hypothetical protein
MATISPSYTARVVLHRTDGSDDYTDLHVLLEQQGFKRIITADDDKQYKLPAGTYFFDATAPLNTYQGYTLEKAYQAVEMAVAEVMRDERRYIQDANTPPSIFVVQSDVAIWSGLKAVPRLQRRTIQGRQSS